MKLELKAEGVSKVNFHKILGPVQTNTENQRICEANESKFVLPKIGQTFLNISAYATKFRDSKFVHKGFSRNVRRKLLQDKNIRK